MDKRTFIAVAVVLGGLFLWQILASKTPPMPIATTPIQQTATAPASAPTAGVPTAALAPPVVAAVAPPPAEFHTVVTPESRIAFSSVGGALHQFTLLGYTNSKGEPLELVDQIARTAHAPLKLNLYEESFAYPARPIYKFVPGPSLREFSYVWTDGARVAIERRYTVRDKYVIDLDVVFKRLGPEKVGTRVQLIVSGADDPNVKQSTSMFGEMPDFKSPLCRVDNSVNRKAPADVAKKPELIYGAVSFAGIDRRFFGAFVIPHDPQGHACRMVAEGPVIVALVEPSNKIALEDKTTEVTLKYSAYFGPKNLKILDNLTVDKFGLLKPGLDESVDFWILGFLCRPMLWILNGFHSIFGNWGIAIILLTLVVKILTFPWTQKAYKSMRAMSDLKPKMEEIKAKFENNKERYNQEVMSLYKAHKINPLSGCLPMLLQMPIWIALYRMLNSAVELYHAPFIFWLQDLSAADPYFVLPLVNGATVFAQQLLTPSSIDNKQMKFMLYFMPILFTVFMLFLPAGLVLYIFVSTVLSIAQQWYIKRNAAKVAGGGKVAANVKMAKQVEAK